MVQLLEQPEFSAWSRGVLPQVMHFIPCAQSLAEPKWGLVPDEILG